MARGMPHQTPICNHLITQSLQKKKHPHWRCLLDTLAIVPNFQDNCPKKTLKIAIFGH